MGEIESFDIGGGMTASVYVDQQAHAMSHPGNDAMPEQAGRQHVSQAAWLAIEGKWPGMYSQEQLEIENKRDGTVLLTVEELQGMERLQKAKYAEVDALQKQAAEYSTQALWYRDQWQEERLRKEEARRNCIIAGNWQYQCDQLRKGREEYKPTPEQIEAVRAALPEPKPQWHGGLMLTPSLDHRLGIQQPEGDPAPPLPYWRRSISA